MFDDPRLQLPKRPALCALRRELRAPLRLPARAPNIKHEVARYDQGHFGAEVFLDERQRKIHAGRHSRRRPQAPIANVDGFGIYFDGREFLRKLLCSSPVCRHAARVE